MPPGRVAGRRKDAMKRYPPEGYELSIYFVLIVAVIAIALIAVAWYSNECIMGDACMTWWIP